MRIGPEVILEKVPTTGPSPPHFSFARDYFRHEKIWGPRGYLRGLR